MKQEFYVIVDIDYREVNFYSSEFPNARNRAILSAKQVDGSIVLHRVIEGDKKTDSIIWPENA